MLYAGNPKSEKLTKHDSRKSGPDRALRKICVSPKPQKSARATLACQDDAKCLVVQHRHTLEQSTALRAPAGRDAPSDLGDYPVVAGQTVEAEVASGICGHGLTVLIKARVNIDLFLAHEPSLYPFVCIRDRGPQKDSLVACMRKGSAIAPRLLPAASEAPPLRMNSQARE
jgi:hypothetical protein